MVDLISDNPEAGFWEVVGDPRFLSSNRGRWECYPGTLQIKFVSKMDALVFTLTRRTPIESLASLKVDETGDAFDSLRTKFPWTLKVAFDQKS